MTSTAKAVEEQDVSQPVNAAESKAVAERGKAANDPWLQMIERVALNPEADVSKLREVLDMQKEIFARNAEIAYNAAMSRVQAQIKPIIKSAENQQTRSKYAKLEAIVTAIAPIYTEEGFALSFGTRESKKGENWIVITCKVTHDQGHTEYKEADLPLDIAGINGKVNKTAIHGWGSTSSYGRRYLTCMIFNIPLIDEDDDGNQGAAPGQPYPPAQEQQPQRGSREALPYYPDEDFKKNLRQWTALVKQGKKTPQAIIATVESRFQMSDLQKRKLNSLKPNKEADNGTR